MNKKKGDNKDDSVATPNFRSASFKSKHRNSIDFMKHNHTPLSNRKELNSLNPFRNTDLNSNDNLNAINENNNNNNMNISNNNNNNNDSNAMDVDYMDHQSQNKQNNNNNNNNNNESNINGKENVNESNLNLNIKNPSNNNKNNENKSDDNNMFISHFTETELTDIPTWIRGQLGDIININKSVDIVNHYLTHSIDHRITKSAFAELSFVFSVLTFLFYFVLFCFVETANYQKKLSKFKKYV